MVRASLRLWCEPLCVYGASLSASMVRASLRLWCEPLVSTHCTANSILDGRLSHTILLMCSEKDAFRVRQRRREGYEKSVLFFRREVCISNAIPIQAPSLHSVSLTDSRRERAQIQQSCQHPTIGASRRQLHPFVVHSSTSADVSSP